MTEEKARHYAKALAQSLGITFYVVRSAKAAICRCNGLRTTAKFWRRSRHPTACTILRNFAQLTYPTNLAVLL